MGRIYTSVNNKELEASVEDELVGMFIFWSWHWEMRLNALQKYGGEKG